MVVTSGPLPTTSLNEVGSARYQRSMWGSGQAITRRSRKPAAVAPRISFCCFASDEQLASIATMRRSASGAPPVRATR